MLSDWINKNKGFTLIELMVVVSIIGFLATASLVVFNSARIKSRDAQRIANLKQIQTAVEMYYNEYGYYPKHDGGISQYGYAFSDWGSHCGGWWCNLETLLVPYISPLPRDPKGESQLLNYYYYRTHGDGKSYGLGIRLERSNSSSLSDNGCLNGDYEVGPSLTRCGCSPRVWQDQGTDLCP